MALPQRACRMSSSRANCPRPSAAFRSLFNLGFGAFRNAGAYILTGAMIVVPIWLLMRFMGRR